ncbi:hypothetical protein Hanom_Chr13g01183761 [Helianthus anomalus]
MKQTGIKPKTFVCKQGVLPLHQTHSHYYGVQLNYFMGSIENFIYRFYYFLKKDWGPGTPFRLTWVRPWLHVDFLNLYHYTKKC